MKKLQSKQQQQALNNLLNIHEDIKKISQSNQANQNSQEGYIQNIDCSLKKIYKKKKNQKQNQSYKKIILPRFNNSKEQLKLLLKNLQDEKPQICDILSAKQNRQQQTRSNHQQKVKQQDLNSINQRLHQSKSTIAIQSLLKRNLQKGQKVNNRTKQQLNHLSVMQKTGDDVIHYLLRKNNYNANQLNIKALKILHSIRLNRPRCDTSIKQDKFIKLYNNIEHRKSVLGFVKKTR